MIRTRKWSCFLSMNQTLHSFFSILTHNGRLMSSVGALETNFYVLRRSPSLLALWLGVATQLTLHLSAEESTQRVARPLPPADPLPLITHSHRSCFLPFFSSPASLPQTGHSLSLPPSPSPSLSLSLSSIARHTWVHPGAIKHLRDSEPMIYFDVEKILGKIIFFLLQPFHPSMRAVRFQQVWMKAGKNQTATS